MKQTNCGKTHLPQSAAHSRGLFRQPSDRPLLLAQVTTPRETDRPAQMVLQMTREFGRKKGNWSVCCWSSEGREDPNNRSGSRQIHFHLKEDDDGHAQMVPNR